MAPLAPNTRPRFPEELREALRAREPGALEQFFDTTFDDLHRYVSRAVGTNHGDEVTQETFAHIYQGLAMYDPRRDPRPWAFAIAANQVRAFWRRRAREPVSIDSGDADGPVPLQAPGADPAGHAERQESHAAVRAALAELPHDLREVVQLRIFGGLDHEDIAAALGATAVAVRKRYSRALARLRDALGTLAQTPDAEEVS